MLFVSALQYHFSPETFYINVFFVKTGKCWLTFSSDRSGHFSQVANDIKQLQKILNSSEKVYSVREKVGSN